MAALATKSVFGSLYTVRQQRVKAAIEEAIELTRRGTAAVSEPQLATAARCSERTARTAIQLFKADGVFLVDEKSGRVNHYSRGPNCRGTPAKSATATPAKSAGTPAICRGMVYGRASHASHARVAKNLKPSSTEAITYGSRKASETPTQKPPQRETQKSNPAPAALSPAAHGVPPESPAGKLIAVGFVVSTAIAFSRRYSRGYIESHLRFVERRRSMGYAIESVPRFLNRAMMLNYARCSTRTAGEYARPERSAAWRMPTAGSIAMNLFSDADYRIAAPSPVAFSRAESPHERSRVAGENGVNPR